MSKCCSHGVRERSFHGPVTVSAVETREQNKLSVLAIEGQKFAPWIKTYCFLACFLELGLSSYDVKFADDAKLFRVYKAKLVKSFKRFSGGKSGGRSLKCHMPFDASKHKGRHIEAKISQPHL